ncbi:MAG: C2 family cysteine protease [Actinomycetota bacterium]
MPLNEDGEPIFAEFPYAGIDKDGGNYELWPAIVEKAYARYSGDYREIEGGRAEDALEAMTVSRVRATTWTICRSKSSPASTTRAEPSRCRASTTPTRPTTTPMGSW